MSTGWKLREIRDVFVPKGVNNVFGQVVDVLGLALSFVYLSYEVNATAKSGSIGQKAMNEKGLAIFVEVFSPSSMPAALSAAASLIPIGKPAARESLCLAKRCGDVLACLALKATAAADSSNKRSRPDASDEAEEGQADDM